MILKNTSIIDASSSLIYEINLDSYQQHIAEYISSF